MLLSRVLSAVVLIPVVLVVLYWGGWPLLVLALIAAALGWHEFDHLFRSAGQHLFRFLGLALTLLIVASGHFAGYFDPLLLVAVLVMLSAVHALLELRPPQEAVSAWALTLLGVLYVGWLFRYALLLRDLPAGREWAFTALVVTWAADTGAYLAGRTFGRHRFSPRISPAKTWEGVGGGFALAVVAALLMGGLLLGLDPLSGLLLGILVTVAATTGDLVESLLKRAAGAKDSGALIPGHGGLLDRADSLLFVLPTVYYYALFAIR